MSGLALARLPRGEMRAAAWLLGQPGHRRPVQPGIAHRVGVDLVGAHLQVRRAGLAIEVQRKIVGREDLAERHRRRVLVVGRHVAVVDAEVGQLAADEACRTGRRRRRRSARRDCPAGPRPPRRWRRCRPGTSRTCDVLQPDTDLQGIDVDAAAPDGEDVKWLRGAQCQPSEGVGDSTRYRLCLASRGAVNTLS